MSSARRFTEVYNEVEAQPHRHITGLAEEDFSVTSMTVDVVGSIIAHTAVGLGSGALVGKVAAQVNHPSASGSKSLFGKVEG